MALRTTILWLASVVCVVGGEAAALAQNDIADVPSVKRRVGGDGRMQYLLIGRKQDQPAPDEGFGLLIVLPGGDGSADYQSFVKRIYKFGLPEGYLVVEPIAPQWSKDQEVTWPVKKEQVPKAKFLTQEFLSKLIDEVSNDEKIDPTRRFILGWSSAGLAAYTMALAEPRIGGAFVAMSVFKPDQLPSLEGAKDAAFYIYHSKADEVCPFRMAAQAETDLKAKGATVELATYEGGHGWRGNVYGDLKAGIRWLETNGRQPAP